MRVGARGNFTLLRAIQDFLLRTYGRISSQMQPIVCTVDAVFLGQGFVVQKEHYK